MLKKIPFALVLTMLVSTFASAEIKTEEITYKQGDTELRGFLAYNDQLPGKLPGVLIIPEWWGHDDYVRSRAKQIAELGYVAFAVDMYGNGFHTDDPKEAGKFSKPFIDDRLLTRDRASAGLQVLRSQDRVDASRVAAMGYCFGGMVALELARAQAPVVGVVSFHGSLGTPTPAKEGQIKASVLVLHGAADPMVDQKQVEGFLDEMKTAKADWTFAEFADAQHAFTNPQADSHHLKGISYNEKADKRSWGMMKEYFAQWFAK